MMSISDGLKGAQEMKNLQENLKTIQGERQIRQAQLEPV
jgi:hypothetical protein